jgi:hypothetical protein
MNYPSGIRLNKDERKCLSKPGHLFDNDQKPVAKKEIKPMDHNAHVCRYICVSNTKYGYA